MVQTNLKHVQLLWWFPEHLFHFGFLNSGLHLLKTLYQFLFGNCGAFLASEAKLCLTVANFFTQHWDCSLKSYLPVK